MKHIWQDCEIAKEIGVTTSDIVYHFKKGHIRGSHIENVGWFAAKAEGNRFIKSYLKNKKEKALKKQRNLFNLREEH